MNTTLEARLINTIPGLGDGRGDASQQRPHRHRDGAGTGGARALQPDPALRRHCPGLARPRPVHPVRGPRLDARLRDDAPAGLRRLAVGHPRFPPARLHHSGAPRARPHPRCSRSPPARSGRGSPMRSAWHWPSEGCAPGWARTSSTTARSSSSATATSWKASATKRRRSQAISSSGASSRSTTTITSRSTAALPWRSAMTPPGASSPTAGTSPTWARRPRISTRSSGRCAPRCSSRTGRRWSSSGPISATRCRPRSTPRRHTARSPRPRRSPPPSEPWAWIPTPPSRSTDDVAQAYLQAGARGGAERSRLGSPARCERS